jgi:hypothetical protein
MGSAVKTARPCLSYGFGGFFGSNLTGREHCIHGAWFPISDAEEECLYCHTTRERAKSAN